jgi:hypothetical protein
MRRHIVPIAAMESSFPIHGSSVCKTKNPPGSGGIIRSKVQDYKKLPNTKPPRVPNGFWVMRAALALSLGEIAGKH